MRLARILILDRDIQPRHATLKDLRIIRTRHSVAAVRCSREPRIDRSEVIEGFPRLGLEQVADTCAIRPRRIAKDADRGAFPCTLLRLALLLKPCCIGENVLAHIVLLIAFVEIAHHAHCLIHPAYGVRHCITEQPADACRHVDARPLELCEGDDLKPANTLRRTPPDRAHAHEVEELGDTLSMTAHVRARPKDNANRLGIAPLIADVLLDERIPQLFAILPCSGRRHTARIEAVEITPRRQYIDAVCRRRARRARLDVTPRESTQRLRDLPLRAAQARHHILHDLMQRMGKGGVHLLRGAGYHGQLHRPRDGLRCIVMRRKERDKRTHICLDSVQLSPIGHAIRRHALTVCEQLLIVVPRLLGHKTDKGFLPAMLHAHERTQEIDQRLARRRTSEDVQPRANLHILEVGHIVVEGIGIVVKRIAFVDFSLEVAGGSFLTDKLLCCLDIVRLCCAKMDVLIERLFQFSDLLKLPRKLHRRREMTDEARRTAPLRLNPLPDNRDPVGIDIRQVAQRHIRPAAVRERRALARQPLEGAVRPDVNDRIRLPDVAEPVIVADVVVCGSGVRRVEQLAGILAKAARGLHRDEEIPVQHTRDEQCSIVIEHITGRIPPVSRELCAHLFRQLREKGAVLRCCQLSIGRLCLFRCHKAAIIGRMIRQQLHERLAALRDLLHDVARPLHCPQQREDTLG